MNPETTVGGMKKTSGWSMTWGILMFACGILAILLPRISSIEIVIILAWLILVVGVWHLIFAFHSHSIGGFLWKILLATLYVLFDGIVTLILGILIWRQWPSSSVWVIGTLVGISLIFSGISRFMLAAAARSA